MFENGEPKDKTMQTRQFPYIAKKTLKRVVLLLNKHSHTWPVVKNEALIFYCLSNRIQYKMTFLAFPWALLFLIAFLRGLDVKFATQVSKATYYKLWPIFKIWGRRGSLNKRDYLFGLIIPRFLAGTHRWCQYGRFWTRPVVLSLIRTILFE